MASAVYSEPPSQPHLSISLENAATSSPFPSPSSSFLTPPQPGAHEFAMKPAPTGRSGRKPSIPSLSSTSNSGASSPTAVSPRNSATIPAGQVPIVTTTMSAGAASPMFGKQLSPIPHSPMLTSPSTPTPGSVLRQPAVPPTAAATAAAASDRSVGSSPSTATATSLEPPRSPAPFLSTSSSTTPTKQNVPLPPEDADVAPQGVTTSALEDSLAKISVPNSGDGASTPTTGGGAGGALADNTNIPSSPHTNTISHPNASKPPTASSTAGPSGPPRPRPINTSRRSSRPLSSASLSSTASSASASSASIAFDPALFSSRPAPPSPGGSASYTHGSRPSISRRMSGVSNASSTGGPGGRDRSKSRAQSVSYAPGEMSSASAGSGSRPGSTVVSRANSLRKRSSASTHGSVSVGMGGMGMGTLGAHGEPNAAPNGIVSPGPSHHAHRTSMGSQLSQSYAAPAPSSPLKQAFDMAASVGGLFGKAQVDGEKEKEVEVEEEKEKEMEKDVDGNGEDEKATEGHARATTDGSTITITEDRTDSRTPSATTPSAESSNPTTTSVDLTAPIDPTTSTTTTTTTTTSTTTTTTEPPKPHLHDKIYTRIRDFAFPSTDERYTGLGALVPKPNRIGRLNKKLRWWPRRPRPSRADSRASVGSISSVGSSISSMSSLSSDGDEEEEEEDGDGWGWGGGGGGGFGGGGGQAKTNGWGGGGGFRMGMGRFSWTMGAGGGGATAASIFDQEKAYKDAADNLAAAAAAGGGGGSSARGGAAPGGGGGVYPTRKDMDRNFLDRDSEEFYDAEEDASSYDEDDDSASGAAYDDAEDDGEEEEEEEETLYPGLYRAMYAFEPEGTAEMRLVEDQVVRVVGRGGGVGWAVVVVPLGAAGVPQQQGQNGQPQKHALVPESYLEPVKLDWELEEEKGQVGAAA